MKQLHTTTIFDADLSPKTAMLKGYEYIDDIYLDKRQNNSKEFIQILELNEIKLGIPSKDEYGNFGLYVPKNKFDHNTEIK